MVRASNLGGEIRHAEIRAGQEPVTPEGALARTVGSFVTDTPWMWPTCETLHFVGLSLLCGVVFLVDLRVLGVMKGVSFASLHRLVALGRAGIRLEYRHRYVVLRGDTRPVHTQSCLLLENRTGDARRGERAVLHDSR